MTEAQSEAVFCLAPSAFARLEETGFRALSTCHYELVFADVTPLPSGVLLREAFSSVTRAEGAYRQACWLVEQFGGPPLFTQLRGRGGLLSRHAPYAGVTQEAGDRWLAHMETALSRQIVADAELHDALSHYFRFMVAYVVEGRLLCNPMQSFY